MRNILAISWILALSLTTQLATAQSYYFEQYSVREGLAQSNVYDILIDEGGYIWLGTGSGASRFDGLTFINFNTEDGMAASGVRTILQDVQGRIWFGHNNGGVSVFEGDSMKVVFQLGGDITHIMEDRSANIWAISATHGAIRINDPDFAKEPNPDFQYFKGQEGLSDRVFGMSKTTYGTLYFITDVGIKYYVDGKDQFEFYKPGELPSYFLPTCMLEDSQGVQWFGTHNGGLYKLAPNTDTLVIYDKLKNDLAHNFISTISEDSKGNIWAGTWGGGLTRISQEGTLKVFNALNGLKDDKVRRIIEDREGNILIGTNENGLMIYKGEQFMSYGVQDGMVDDQVWAVYQDAQDRMWFGTNAGISVFDPAANDPWALKLTGEDVIPSEHIRYIKGDLDGNLWIGTWGGGLVKYNPENGTSVFNFNLNYAIQFGNVTALDVDKSGSVWVGTSDGLLRFDSKTGEIERITQELDEEGNKTGLLGNDISALFVDNTGSIWVGSKGKGITRFTPNPRSFTTIEWETAGTPLSFFQIADGDTWVGTEGLGLLRIRGEQITHQFRQHDGLLSDYITQISEDQNKRLWVGTNRGLNRLDPTSGEIRTYTEKDGFTGIETKQNGVFKDSDDNIWFGTVKGAIRNQVGLERELNQEPLTHITGLRVNLERRPLKESQTFNHREKNIILDYTSISLANPEAVRYKVMLKGLENDWRDPSSQKYVQYSSLPPGDYEFGVIGINGLGIANTEPLTYKFSIRPPFWQTWWFYLLCAVVIAAGFVAFIKIRERNLKIEKAILKQTVAERTAEVVHQKEELAEKNKDIMDSIRYAERIQRAILPLEEKMNEHLSDVFVLFKPKDIVSGDFYWFTSRQGRIFFSAIDCTGHGVPGAFVSLIGNNGLQRAVNEFHLQRPGEILDHLRHFVVDVFEAQEGTTDVKDGMDMGLCSFDTKTNKLEFAGANNPMYLVRNGEVEIIKPDKMCVGAYSGVPEDFNTYEFELQKGDCVYLLSDGYADQFGGPKGKKFKYRPLQRLLLENCDRPMSEQKKILDDTIEEWMHYGGEKYEQIDDICIVGVRA